MLLTGIETIPTEFPPSPTTLTTQTKDDSAILTALEQIIENGFDGLDTAVSILINEAMRIERSRVLEADSWQRTEARKGYAKGLGRRENLYSLNARNAVFVAVDMQNFVCSPEPGRILPGMEKVVAHINLMADFCQAQAIPVIWLRQCFTKNTTGDDVGL